MSWRSFDCIRIYTYMMHVWCGYNYKQGFIDYTILVYPSNLKVHLRRFIWGGILHVEAPRMGWMGCGGVDGGYRRELHPWLFRTVGLFENQLGRKTVKKGKWIFLVIASESQNLWMTKSFCSPAWLKSYLYCSDNFHPRTNSFKIH